MYLLLYCINWIVSYLLFTDLNLSIGIYNQKIDCEIQLYWRINNKESLKVIIDLII